MKYLNKVSRYLLGSIILFSILTSLISLSVWLDMRIHSRHVVYLSFIIMLIFIIKDFISVKGLGIGGLLMLIAFALGKFPRVSYELRDAFYLPIKIDQFKIFLIIIIIITSIITIYDYYINSNKTQI